MTIPKKPTKPTKPRKAAPKAPLVTRVAALEAEVARLSSRPVIELDTVFRVLAIGPVGALVKFTSLAGVRFSARWNFEHEGTRYRIGEAVGGLSDAEARRLLSAGTITPNYPHISTELRAELEAK